MPLDHRVVLTLWGRERNECRDSVPYHTGTSLLYRADIHVVYKSSDGELAGNVLFHKRAITGHCGRYCMNSCTVTKIKIMNEKYVFKDILRMTELQYILLHCNTNLLKPSIM